MPEIKTLLIRDLDDSFQIRANGTNSEKVQQYCEMFREYHGWGSFPPLTVVSITDDDEFPPGLYIADGIHRYQAALLANVGIQEVKCEVWEGGRDLLYDKSLAVNAFQGLGMGTEELKAARKRIIKDLWPTRKYNPDRLAEICHCNPNTIRRDIQKFEAEGLIPHIESVIGADGKEYPTSKVKSVLTNVRTGKPDTPCHFCAGGCGTPIWEEMKNAPDSTYFHLQKNGMTLWFCSEECYRHSWHCPPDEKECEDVEEDDAPVYVKCPKCGKRELEKNLHSAGWVHEKEEGYSGKDLWYCSKECRDWMKALSDESWKTEEPPARVPAPSSCQASGEEPEQEEEPDEFAFTDVDEETLPVCTEEHKETDELETQIVVRVRTKAFKTAQEFVNSLSVIDGKFQIHLFGSDVDAEFLGLYENNNLINNNINTNPEIFTDFYVCCKSTKGRKVKLFISKAKYSEWKRQFGPPFDIDQNLQECCKYYNELTGSEMLSASGVYAKVFAWLLRNWKQEQKQSKPKQNAYKDAGLRFDPSDY